MLRGIFGTKKSILPPPPKNQIEVVCPACGAAQYEPRLVVSTFCRACGVHLTIQKKKVVASSVTRSGAAGVNDLWDSTPAQRHAPQPQTTPPEAKPQVKHTLSPLVFGGPTLPPPPQDATPEPALETDPSSVAAAQTGFGAFLQAVSKTPPAAPAPAETSLPPLQPPPTEPLPATVQPELPAPIAAPPPPANRVPAPKLISSSPAPPPSSTLEKMKSQSVYRQQYFKEVECFECHHKFKVGRSAKSAVCSECAAPICIEDFDINQRSHQPIRTRGDLIIRKPGHIAAASIECKDLRCLGTIDAPVRCHNEAVFRTEGTIAGPIHCFKFTVEKGADVTFLNTVKAEEMYINSRITANLHAAGKVIIGPYGSVNGDVTARAVSIEPGGELNGAMNIIRHTPPAVPSPSDA